MRLFIGVTFKEEILNEIQKTLEAIKKISVKGNITVKENLHLTLIFLGEVDESRLVKIEESMNGIVVDPFCIKINKICSFKRKGGDIYWIGFKNSAHLQHLYNNRKKSSIKSRQRLRKHLSGNNKNSS